MTVFEAFPKIPRLKREVVITEKIDGTNAQIYITDGPESDAAAKPLAQFEDGRCVYTCSRNRVISLGSDNYGFARWVYDNARELADGLGLGRHFGEWWGAGIQRRYGLSEKRFSLFNTARWGEGRQTPPACCSVVPLLAQGEWTEVNAQIERLRAEGSVAAPGFMDPEGIVVYHRASGGMFKVTCKDDEKAKGQDA